MLFCIKITMATSKLLLNVLLSSSLLLSSLVRTQFKGYRSALTNAQEDSRQSQYPHLQIG